MAKSGFWLRGAKGKLAGTTLYQSGGRTIQREIVTPKNPQTDNQMRQRIHMAVASKFYQDAQQARFAVAFANKKSNQSDFNAFTSANLKEFGTLIYPTKDQLNNPAFCAYMPWICSQGNLQAIDVAESDDQMSYIGALVYLSDSSTGIYTSWEEVIAGNPTLNLQYGDIITVTAVLNDMRCPDGNIVIGNRAPVWVTRQFIIGADLGDGSLQEYFNLNGFDLSYSLIESTRHTPFIDLESAYGTEETLYFGPDELADNKTALMCCVTRSRYEGGKTLVSNSRFWLDDEAWKIVTRLGFDSQLYEAIESFKKGAASSASTPTEVLQGAVAVEPDKAMNLLYTKSDGKQGQRTSFPASGINAYGDRDTEECFGYIILDFSKLNALEDVEVVWTAGTSTVARGIVPVAEYANRKRVVVTLRAPLSTGETGQPFTIKAQGKNLASGTMTF